MFKAVTIGLVGAMLWLPAVVGAQEPPPPRRIPLEEAAALFAANSQALRVARAEAAARAASARTIGQLPNPSLGVTREALRDGAARAGETYLTLNQAVRWPWSGAARRGAVDQAERLAIAQIRADSLDLLYFVRQAWVDAWLAEQRQLALTRVAALIREAHGLAEQRYQAGDLSALDLGRLRLERVRNDRLQAVGSLAVDSARRALAAAILPPGDSSRVAPASLPELPDLRRSPVAGVVPATDDHPVVLAAWAQLEWARAEARAEETLRVPGPTLTAGWKRQDDGLSGLFLGVAMPVPVADRRQGSRAVAAARVAAAEAALDRAERLVRDQFQQAVARHQSVTALLSRATEPAPERDLLSIALIGYQGGELDLTDLLSAATSWRDLGTLQSELLAEFWLSQFAVERAAGSTLQISTSAPAPTGEESR